jgi:hypothetical protein
MFKPIPVVNLATLPGKLKGKLSLTPEQLLVVIHAQELAAWSLQASAHLRPLKLKKGPGGRPAKDWF